MSKPMFDSLNRMQKIEFLEALTPDALKEMIRSIGLPVQLLSMYFADGKHIAWILTDAKIVKTKSLKKEGKKNGSTT